MVARSDISTKITSGPTPEMLAACEEIKSQLPPELLKSGKLIPSFVPSDPNNYYAGMRLLGYAGSILAGTYSHLVTSNKIKDLPEIDVTKSKDVYERNNTKDLFTKEASKRFSIIEFAAFTTLATVYAIIEGQDLHSKLGPSIAAELNKPHSKLTMKDYFASKNPIIETGIQRYSFKTIARTIGHSFFLKDMVWGAMAVAMLVTLERSIFNKNTAYDRIEKLIDNVQKDNFDIHAEDKVARELANIIQQSQKDHGREGWDRKLLIHYEPLFAQMADLIVRKEMGIAEVAYQFGEMMTKRLTPKQSMQCFEKMRDHGLRVIAGGYPIAEPQSTLTDKVVSFKDYATRAEPSSLSRG